MPQFEPSEIKTAKIPIIVKPAGLNCSVEVYLVTDGIRVGTPGVASFTSTGAKQYITLSVIMPGIEGSYPVWIDVFADSMPLVAYVSTENVIIARPPEAYEVTSVEYPNQVQTGNPYTLRVQLYLPPKVIEEEGVKVNAGFQLFLNIWGRTAVWSNYRICEYQSGIIDYTPISITPTKADHYTYTFNLLAAVWDRENPLAFPLDPGEYDIKVRLRCWWEVPGVGADYYEVWGWTKIGSLKVIPNPAYSRTYNELADFARFGLGPIGKGKIWIGCAFLQAHLGYTVNEIIYGTNGLRQISLAHPSYGYAEMLAEWERLH